MKLRRLIYNEYIKYIFIGGMTALLYLGAIALGTEILGVEYRVVVSFSYFMAVSFHFVSNRRFTFGASGGNIRIQVVRYVSVLLLNYLITISVVTCSVEFLFFSNLAAATMAICSTVVIGYLTSKFWVFNKKGEP